MDNGDPIEKSIYKKELLIPIYKDEFKPWEIIASSVGHNLLTMARDISLLEFVVGKGKTPFYNVIPTKECSNKLTTLNMTSARMPSDFPMVYIPNRWSSVPGGFKYGGYLWNDIKGRQELFYNKSVYPAMSGIDSTNNRDVYFKNGNPVVNAINALSCTPYRIAKETLKFFVENNSELNLYT